MASDPNEPASRRPEPMAANRPRSRTVIIITCIVGAIIVAIAVGTLVGVFQSPAWTQSDPTS